jgi:tetratricopeptide (TPR) repeat protein/nicotinamide mononucleotide adenylyltransferase
MKRSRASLWLAAAVLVLGAGIGTYLVRQSRPPGPGSATYEETVRQFYRGLASLQVGLLENATKEFGQAAALVPDEPASWANLGVTHLRLGGFDEAAQAFDRAAVLAPDSSHVALLVGQLEASRGRLDEAIAGLRRAVELDPGNLRARYALAEQVEAAGGQDADRLAREQIGALLELRPGNLAVLLERARLAAKNADADGLRDSVRRLDSLAGGWPEVVQEQYRALQQAVAGTDMAETARAVAVLRNVLVRVPAFREDLLAIRTPAELIAEPFDRFVVLPAPPATAAPIDGGLSFEPVALGGAEAAGPLTALLTLPLGESETLAVVATTAGGLRRVETSGAQVLASGGSMMPAGASRLLALDWNRDFRMDLAVAGAGGVRLLAQEADGTFADLAPAASGDWFEAGDYLGVWAADVEMDGDLDLIAGVRAGEPPVLRNNGDGTWREIRPFAGIDGLRAFAWGDLDEDGDPDAAILDAAGSLHVFENRQAGEFRALRLPAGGRVYVALAIGDLDADGTLDLVTLDARGSFRSLSNRGDAWDERELTVWQEIPVDAEPGGARLLLADLDNNGALDVVASGSGRTGLWLGGGSDGLQGLSDVPAADIFSIADLNGDGQLDLVGLAGGRPVRLTGRGTRGYHWQVLRPRAQPTAGDQRINSFGVGGEIQIRSGLLTQKQVLTGMPVHFGLGGRTGIDVARIVWPNGVMQADFDRGADEVILAEQRLKGSCPWVFTYDGNGMRFVTDFLWRSPLGLRINAQDTAGVTQTEDWIRIRGDQLVARDGVYDVRITAELWETHFVDHVALVAVDHPADVEVFVDERFSAEPPALVVHPMRRLRSVPQAWDETGRDVTDLVSRQDGRYLATFARGPYQGIAQPHWVEFELDGEIARDAPTWLVAHGWVYPTDSSINVAVGQNVNVEPRALSLEARDAAGRWVAVLPDLGFPAGKNKTIAIDLRAVAQAGLAGPTRLRLATNLEVYWDRIAVADGLPEGPRGSMRERRIAAAGAELRYRGFSQTSYDRREVPETPEYRRIANVTPRWRDLVGYYTRFGDVRELIDRVDDRYVIMNAGDELRLTFAALPAPPSGWRRDFVLIGNGWEKDGDYNTAFSNTVQPLPSHDRPDYEAAAVGDLESDPVYRRHARDWQTYHTRYVTPRAFLDGVR